MTFSAEDPEDGTEHAAHVHFQPLVDLRAWRVIGAEALARFDDGRSPLTHLADATADGTCEELELRLIATAIQDAPLLPDALLITVNASGTTMLRPELRPLMAALRLPWGLELFEAATPVDPDDVRAVATDLGGLLLIDDAGAAQANTERIARTRPDIVKIDRQLFWDADSDPAAREHLDALIAAARAVGAQVLIEGIAEESHVERAHLLGADLGQGFHLGRPTPASEFVTMLRELHGRIGVDAPGL